MKFALAKEHRDYFQMQQVVAFEELLSVSQLSEAMNAVHQVLTQRGKSSGTDLTRDMWRDHSVLKKLVKQSTFADIAGELMQQKSLRLGFDQYFSGGSDLEWDALSSKKKLFENDGPLQATSCIQGVVCGLMLCLKGEYFEEEKLQETDSENPLPYVDIFPKKAGQGIFFSSKLPITFSNLTKRNGQHFLLIAYAQPNAVYILQEKDPNVHMLKSIGYAFGDKLSDKLHPMIYR